MKRRLHLSVGELSKAAQSLIEGEKAADPKAVIEAKVLTTENGPEILAEIFSADSVCFWNGKK